MSGKGFDSRAIKMPKSVKRVACKFHDKHERGYFLKSYVRVIEDQSRNRGPRDFVNNNDE